MLNRLQKSYATKDKGFTLIELLVVVVIIGILAGIAIPVFLNQKQKGVEAGMKSDVKNAATYAETFYTDNNSYDGISLTALEDDYSFKSTGDNEVVVDAVAGGYCISVTNDNADGVEYFLGTDGDLNDTACGQA